MLFKYRLTTLFSLIVLVAVLLLVYLRLWPASPLLAAVTTIAIVSVVSIYLDFKRNGTGAFGAFTGGLLGGLLAAIFHVASSYLRLSFLGDGTVLIVVWIVISGFYLSITIWVVVATVLWVNPADMRARLIQKPADAVDRQPRGHPELPTRPA